MHPRDAGPPVAAAVDPARSAQQRWTGQRAQQRRCRRRRNGRQAGCDRRPAPRLRPPAPLPAPSGARATTAPRRRPRHVAVEPRTPLERAHGHAVHASGAPHRGDRLAIVDRKKGAGLAGRPVRAVVAADDRHVRPLLVHVHGARIQASGECRGRVGGLHEVRIPVPQHHATGGHRAAADVAETRRHRRNASTAKSRATIASSTRACTSEIQNRPMRESIRGPRKFLQRVRRGPTAGCGLSA